MLNQVQHDSEGQVADEVIAISNQLTVCQGIS